MLSKLKGVLASVVVATLAVPLAACSSGGDSPGAGGDTSINVLTLQDPFFYAIQELLPEYEKQFGVKVNLEGVDYDTLNSRATNSFMSNNGDIDVIAPDSMWLSRFADSKWLAPLDDRIKQDNAEVAIQDFVPSSLHSLSEWNGHLYTLPAATYGSAVLYRPSVFKELGLKAPPAKPSDSWTWDQYLSDIEAINGKTVDGTKMYGTDVLGAGPQPITHMWSQVAASKGGRWFTAFPDAPKWDFTPTFASAAMVDSMDYYKQLYRNSPPGAINNLWFDAGTQFGAGDIGMMYHWTPYAYLVQRTEYMGTKESAIGDDYKLAAIPKQPGVEQVSNVGGFAFGVAANSKKQDQGWNFVKWAASAETQKKMGLLKNRQFADFSRVSLYDDPELLKAYPWLPTQLSIIEQGDGKTVRPPSKNYSELEQAIGTNLNKMLANDVSGADTAKAIQESLTATLNEQQYIPWNGESYDDTLAATKTLIAQLSAS